MKQNFRILALSALAMLGTGTAIAGDWVVPAPTFQAMNPVASDAKTADTVYVWNVGQQGFVAGGEAWGTQAAISSTSTEKWVVITTSEDGVYKLKNSARTKYLFRTYSDGNVGKGNKTCFVDGSDANDTWAIASVGNNAYTIQMPASASDIDESSNPYDATLFLGVLTSHASSWAATNNDGVTKGLYYDVAYAGNEANCQFAFISTASYNVYAAKVKMKSMLEDAESRGVDVSSEGAVFNNTSATLDEVNAAITSLNTKISTMVTPDNPQDMTNMITNADFSSGNTTGWTSTTAAQNKAIATNVSTDTAANPDGAFSGNFYENWKGTAISGHMYQTVKGLPEGIYKVGIAAYVNKLDDNNSINQKQYVYANDQKVLLTTGNAHAYTIIVNLVGTDTLQIGLAQDSLLANWMGVDNATLQYLGKGIASYQYLNQSVMNDIEAAIADNESSAFAYAESVYETAKTAAQKGLDATDVTASYAAYLEALDGLADLKNNIVAYANLYTSADKAESEFYENYSDQDALYDASQEGMTMFEEHTATTAEVLAMIQKIADALQQAKLASYQAGDDVTHIITNPTFNDETKEATYAQPQSTTGWIGAGGIGSGWITDTRLAEVYDQDCDIHQDLTGLKKGAYRLSIQAFYRPAGASSANYQAYLNGDSLTQAYIYMGLTQQRVKSIYACTFPESITTMSRENHWVNVGSDEAAYVPNTMDEAYVCFNGSYDGEQDAAYDNNYRNVVYGVVTEDGGTMPIGFKIENHASTSWVIFRDFRLEYLGNDATYIRPVLENKMKEAQTDYVAKKMAADDKTAIDNAVAVGQTALDNNDGDAMMDAFTAIANAESQADASIAAYANLAASYDSLTAQYDASEKASQDVRTKALTLINEVKDLLNNGTIAVADIPAKQEEMKAVRMELMALPGSDAEPANYTNWIQNPTYGSATGWTIDKTSGDGVPGIQYNTMEIWNATADIYQDIYDLPEGTYEVKVQSLFRPVSAAEAWADLLGDSIENYGERASIYANWDAITPSYWCSKYNPDQYSWTTGSYIDMNDTLSVTETDTTVVTYHFANTRQAAEYQFQMNYYPVQSFFTYVGSDGHLRLGFKNTEHKVQDWFVVSNWELYYYGANSSHASATGISDINNSDDAKISEVYTVDGRRVNGLQKGLNIVRAKTANGQIVTKKIVVK